MTTALGQSTCPSEEEVDDLFVSYAHADDEVPANTTSGWVTTLVIELKKVLRRKLGGQGARVWMDSQLAANEPVTDTLLRRLTRSRALLLVLSPGYRRSDWCQRELANFAAQARAQGGRDSIFVLEVEGVRRQDWPVALLDLNFVSFVEKQRGKLAGYPTPRPDEDSLYWTQLTALADMIAQRLNRAPDPLPPSARHMVMVAEPADDIDHQHASMVGALRQRPDVELLPAYPYAATTADAYESSVLRDLERAALHVQLLSLSPGRRLPDGERRIVTLQAQLAHRECERRGLRLMRWSQSGTNAVAPDSMLAEVLGDTGISRMEFEAFRMAVMRAVDELSPVRTASVVATPLPTAPPPATVPAADAASANPKSVDAEGLSIYVQAAPEDAANAERVADHLAAGGATVQLSPDTGPGQAFIESLRAQEEALRMCDGVLLLYGHSPVTAVSIAFQYAQRVFGLRRDAVWSAVLDLPGPPGHKPPVPVRSRNLMTIDCSTGFDPVRLGPFYAALRRNGGERPHA
jgi:hypothetical protein